MKTIFLGTPEFALPALEVLNEKTDLALVITQADRPRGRGRKPAASPVKKRALDLGLDLFQPEDINDPDAVRILEEIQPDLILVVAYGQILKKPILEIPRREILNIHASILPDYRGAAPIERAILEGEEETGVSIMRVEEGLDSGPVALVKTCPIGDKNGQDLTQALADLGAQALAEVLDLMEEGDLDFEDQDHAQASYAEKIDPSLGQMDPWEETAKKTLARVRALAPKPGAYFYLDGEKIKVLEARTAKEDIGGQAGTLRVQGKSLYLNTREGALELLKIQRPGKRAMDTASFLNGFSIEDKTPLDGA